ncbi:MAG: MBL fold metallo-hydrolase [Sphingomonas sp.]
MIDRWRAVALIPALAGGALAAMPAYASARPAESAAEILHAAIAAQGGEAALRAIATIEWHASGYRNELEQSERPEGPYTTEFDDIVELHDVAGGRLATTTNATISPYPPFAQGLVADRTTAMKVAGGTGSAGNAALLATARETLALSPERLLLTASAARDLQREPDAMLQNVPQQIVRFSLDGAPVRIFLNGFTHLPTAVDYSGASARAGYWRFLGDVTMRTSYGFWWVAKTGVRLPLQVNVTRNGLPDSEVLLKSITINGAPDEARLRIPPDVRAAFAAGKTPASVDDLPFGAGQPPVDIVPGVTLFTGAWNVTLVRQDDGVVVIEAPISSGYSVGALAAAARLYPGVKVKAVVTTSDSWPHLAGIREYAARGIPIYGLDLNVPILTRVIAAPYASRPDRQQRAPRPPILRPVSAKTVIGTGANRIELYPLRGETSERQMMAWLPAHRLLYGSDPFQRTQTGDYAYPQTVSELTDAARREGLRPDRFFMMHIGPTPWRELQDVATRAAAKDSPGGE